MITENRLTTYINSLAQGDGPLIETIAENAVKNRVPIIRRETASLLKTMVTLVAPNRILEVGTAVGYSALLMASVMPKECRITTIEKYEKRIPEAKENFRLAGMEEKITLLVMLVATFVIFFGPICFSAIPPVKAVLLACMPSFSLSWGWIVLLRSLSRKEDFAK